MIIFRSILRQIIPLGYPYSPAVIFQPVSICSMLLPGPLQRIRQFGNGVFPAVARAVASRYILVDVEDVVGGGSDLKDFYFYFNRFCHGTAIILAIVDRKSYGTVIHIWGGRSIAVSHRPYCRLPFG